MHDHSTSFTKRVKRRISGRVQTFFIATAPGFESLCLEELTTLRPELIDIKRVNGGVAFKGNLVDCYLANLELRTANRILMRIGHFKATHFRQLEKRLDDIPWALYLPNGTAPSVSVTTHRSRLYHTTAIADRFKESFTRRPSEGRSRVNSEKESTVPQKIFVRVDEDRFTVSIDSSGNHLYKRGIKKHGGKAPLRETIAAAALRFVGYTGREPLCDPMCGAGTFSLEGAMILKKIPPGWYRSFAFMGWPAFRHRQWAYFKKAAETRITSFHRPLIFASDSDREACRQLDSALQKNGLMDVVNVSHKDFFDLNPKRFSKTRGLITLNPPYGRRIGTRRESRKRFGAICEKLVKDFSGWNAIIIVPEKKGLNKLLFDLDRRPFFHGGLKLFMLTGKI